jgi:hypothetical protein
VSLGSDDVLDMDAGVDAGVAAADADAGVIVSAVFDNVGDTGAAGCDGAR